MAIIKSISSKAPIKGAINYISNQEKTNEQLMEGINCSSDPQAAYQEMIVTKKIHNKTDGRQYKHYVLSYSPEDNISPEQALENAKDLVKRTKEFEGHEVFLSAHTDKDYVHVHWIVNSVNYENGYKLQTSNQGLEDLKNRCNQQCKEQGLVITNKNNEITAWSKDKYKALEKSITGNYKSYVLDCYKAVSEAKETAMNKADFIEKMKEKGYETNWNDRRKNITFTDINRKENGESKYKIRNSNLEKTFKEDFSKEGLENGFKANAERANERREEFERIRTGTNHRTSEETRTGNQEFRGYDIKAELNDQQSAIDNLSAQREQREINRLYKERERNRERERDSKERQHRPERRKQKTKNARERISKSRGFER